MMDRSAGLIPSTFGGNGGGNYVQQRKCLVSNTTFMPQNKAAPHLQSERLCPHPLRMRKSEQATGRKLQVALLWAEKKYHAAVTLDSACLERTTAPSRQPSQAAEARLALTNNSGSL